MHAPKANGDKRGDKIHGFTEGFQPPLPDFDEDTPAPPVKRGRGRPKKIGSTGSPKKLQAFGVPPGDARAASTKKTPGKSKARRVAAKKSAPKTNEDQRALERLRKSVHNVDFCRAQDDLIDLISGQGVFARRGNDRLDQLTPYTLTAEDYADLGSCLETIKAATKIWQRFEDRIRTRKA